MEGFIYLHRKMLDWEWYDDINTCRVFLHCLFKANWKPCKWHGVDIEAGQFITSLQNLATETGLSVRQIRTSLEHLISTGELTSKSHSKFRIITVNNWDRYQAIDKQVDKQATKKRQGSDKVATTDEERNKEIKKEGKETKHIYGEFNHVRLTDTERDKLRSEFGDLETEEAIKYLDEYIEMKGISYKSDYLAMRKWVFDAVKRDKQKDKPKQSNQSLAEKWGIAT